MTVPIGQMAHLETTHTENTAAQQSWRSASLTRTGLDEGGRYVPHSVEQLRHPKEKMRCLTKQQHMTRLNSLA